MSEKYNLIKALEYWAEFGDGFELTPEQCKWIVDWYEKWHKCQSLACKQEQRIAELEARIKELYADNEALREHYPHFLSSEQEANYVDGVLKREWNTPEEDEAWEGLLGSSSIEKAVETVKDDPLYGGEG